MRIAFELLVLLGLGVTVDASCCPCQKVCQQSNQREIDPHHSSNTINQQAPLPPYVRINLPPCKTGSKGSEHDGMSYVDYKKSRAHDLPPPTSSPPSPSSPPPHQQQWAPSTVQGRQSESRCHCPSCQKVERSYEQPYEQSRKESDERPYKRLNPVHEGHQSGQIPNPPSCNCFQATERPHPDIHEPTMSDTFNPPRNVSHSRLGFNRPPQVEEDQRESSYESRNTEEQRYHH